MWPFSRTVPAREHTSCSRQIGALIERVEKLELATVERNLQVLDIAEKVAEKLKDRVKHRRQTADQDGGDEIDRLIAIRRQHHVHGG